MSFSFHGAVVTALAFLMVGCASVPEKNPQIYNPRADGKKQLAAALRQARSTDKRVLLNLGANWCGDSQAMHRLLTTNAEIQQIITDRYVLTLADVNKRDGRERNRELQAQLGNPVSRIPLLLILDQQGSVLNNDPAERLADSDHQHPDRVLAYLRKWAGSGR